MKTSAAVIAALFATVEAINIRQLGFLKAQEQLNGPAVGNEHPRFCDLGASATDVNEQGCILDKQHNAIRSAPRAAGDLAPVGGLASLNYNKQTPSTAPASLPRPNTVHNLTDSPNGMVSIPFAYVQIGGVDDVAPKEGADPSKEATEDPIKLEAEKLAKANEEHKLTEGNEHEAGKAVETPEEKAKVQKEEDQSKAQGAALKLLSAAEKAAPEPVEKDNGAKWDNRAATDEARAAAAGTVASQHAEEAKNVSDNAGIVAKATDATAASINVNSRNREGVNANSWHEQWVTKVVPQPNGDAYSADRQLRSGEPTKAEKEAAKANGPSEKEEKQEANAKEDDAKNAAAAAKADAGPAAAPKADATPAAAPEAAALIQIRTPSLSDQEEANYQKVYDAEQTRLKAAQKTLADQITANEKFRSEHAVTLVQTPSLSDQEEANYQKVYDAEQTRLKAAQKTLADQITANETYRSEHAVTL